MTGVRPREGGRKKERCIMGYEIKYSMSALFWSPSPSSTPRVSSLEGGGGDGGGGVVAKRGEGGNAEDRRDRCVNEEETEGKEQMRGSTVLTDVSCNMWWRTITA